jgi:hypothetical protein
VATYSRDELSTIDLSWHGFKELLGEVTGTLTRDGLAALQIDSSDTMPLLTKDGLGHRSGFFRGRQPVLCPVFGAAARPSPCYRRHDAATHTGFGQDRIGSLTAGNPHSGTASHT